MNPWPMIKADLRQLGWVAGAVAALIAAAVAVDVALLGLERGMRAGATRAADDFDLLIGAPGSPAQLVLSTVYLEPEALPVTGGDLLAELGRDPRVAAVAPLVLGDIAGGYPVVGTTAAFAGRFGRLAPTEGRLFAAIGEAVVGADAALPLGGTVMPSHAPRYAGLPLGRVGAEEKNHRHGGPGLAIVGRMARTGTAWDRAVLVPVEAVWQAHGLGTGHAAAEALGPPFDAGAIPGVSALVVKPRSAADAYALRARYGQGGRGATMALFPAEVLVGLYRRIGSARDLMLAVNALNGALLLAVITVLLIAVGGLRRQRYAALRALGAPPRYILAASWGGAALLAGSGAALGLVLGWLAVAALAGPLLAARTGLALAGGPVAGDALWALGAALAASVLALVPAVLAYRVSVADGLRGTSP
jgi:putative ABC transport system permease protein